MPSQTRWICGACAVEWVPFFVRTIDYAAHAAHPDPNGPQGRAWTETDGCPKCGHQGIRQVTYDAAFPGADLPRPALAPIAPTPIVVPERRNATLLEARRPTRKRRTHP